MIRRGRPVLDMRGLATVHGFSERAARSRRVWRKPGHPPPVQRAAGPWPLLWDSEQVETFLAGRQWRPLPVEPHPDDLLNSREAADYVGQSPATWDSNEHLGYVPPADQVVHGMKVWKRSTLDSFRAGARPRAPGRRGRRARDAESGRTAAQDRVLHAAQAARESGEGDLTLRELARRAGVSKPTAHRYRP